MRKFLPVLIAALLALPTLAQAQRKPAYVLVLMDVHPTSKGYSIQPAVADFIGRLSGNDLGAVYALAPTKKVVTEFTHIATEGKAAIRQIKRYRTHKFKRNLTDAGNVGVAQIAGFPQDVIRSVVIVTAGYTIPDMADFEAGLVGYIKGLEETPVQVSVVALGDVDLAPLRRLVSLGGQVYTANNSVELQAAMKRLSINLARSQEGQAVLEEGATADPNKKPADAVKKPVDGAEKPADGAEKPADGAEKPADGAEKPADGAEKPADGAEKPADGAEKPADGAEKPADGAEKPADGAKKPADEGKKPKDVVEKPKDKTNKEKDRKRPVAKKPKDDDEEDEEDEEDESEEEEEEEASTTKKKKGTPLWVWIAAGGGGLLVVILIILLVVFRRRGADDDEEEEYEEEEGFDAAAHFGAKGGGEKKAGGGKGGSKKGGGVARARFVPMVDAQEEFEFASDSEVLTLGRKAVNNVVVESRGCSGFHAELRWDAGQLIVVDKGSTNGTFVNDKRVSERALNSGDVVRFDSVAYRVGGQTSVQAGGGEVFETEDPGGGGDQDERTMMLSGDDPFMKQLREEDAPEPEAFEPEEDSVVVSHKNCVRHKRRVAQQSCDVCSLPYCSGCLSEVLGEQMCPKCRAAGHGG